MSAGHNRKEIKPILAELDRLGFTITQQRNGTFKITPPEHIGGQTYNTHLTPGCIHPLIRDFKRMYGVDLSHLNSKHQKKKGQR